MELSRDTWHYRNFKAWQAKSYSKKHQLLRWGDVEPNLCIYTRIALFYGAWHRWTTWLEKSPRRENTSLAALVYLGVLGLLGFIVLLAPEQGWNHWFWLVPLGVMAALAVILAVGGVIAVGVDWIITRVKERPTGSKGEPSLVVEYVKAKKSKICPLIEFKD